MPICSKVCICLFIHLWVNIWRSSCWLNCMCFKTYTVRTIYTGWPNYVLLFNLQCHDCLRQYISAFKCHVNFTRYLMDTDGHANNSMVGEGETEQETDKTRQIEELVPKWSSTSVAWMWFDCENLIQTRKLYSASHDNRLKHHKPLLPPTQELLDREYGQSFRNDKHKRTVKCLCKNHLCWACNHFFKLFCLLWINILTF